MLDIIPELKVPPSLKKREGGTEDILAKFWIKSWKTFIVQCKPIQQNYNNVFLIENIYLN